MRYGTDLIFIQTFYFKAFWRYSPVFHISRNIIIYFFYFFFIFLSLNNAREMEQNKDITKTVNLRLSGRFMSVPYLFPILKFFYHENYKIYNKPFKILYFWEI